MNKFFAIVLLAVMMLVVVHPAIAMHFCGGELYSFDLFEIKDQKACCVSDLSTSCCAYETMHGHSGPLPITLNNSGFDNPKNSCCEFETVHMSTSDYESKIEQHSINKRFITFENILLVLTSSFNLSESKAISNLLPKVFPPGGLFLKDVSINTFVCNYRI